MVVPGLHPSSRTVSLESAEQLRELSEICQRQEEYGPLHNAPSVSDGSPIRASSMSKCEELELNELLNLNPSIYDLTVQYSCLAVHRCGGKAGFPSLMMVLALEILNVAIQMGILLEVNQLVAIPAKANAMRLYRRFTEECYDGDYVFSEIVAQRFQDWNDDTSKTALCAFPLTYCPFFFLILIIWTFYLMHEFKQTSYFWWHTIVLQQPHDGKVTFLNHGDNFIITHMNHALKMWVTVTVFFPKLIIAFVLWYIGAGWLTATTGIDNLVLNSLALTFICEIDELIFRTCISEVAKSCLEKTKLPLPSFKYTPSYWLPIESLSTCLGSIAMAALYLFYFQDAIPDYRWDLMETCADHRDRRVS